VIDPEPKGRKMCLRNSMRKFDGHIDALPEIEIAKAFERPGRCFLNKSVVKKY
jgi:hypothetical protein